MATAFLLTMVLAYLMRIHHSLLLTALCVACLLPAGVDFALEELVKSYPASNTLRFATGLIFGAGAGLCAYYGIVEHIWLPATLFLSGAAVMHFSIAVLFRICGHLEEYISKYAEAVRY